MPWNQDDYLAAGIIIFIIIVALVIGLYIATQYKTQTPLKFQGNQTATKEPMAGIWNSQKQSIIAWMVPGSLAIDLEIKS